MKLEIEIKSRSKVKKEERGRSLWCGDLKDGGAIDDNLIERNLDSQTVE